MDTLTRYVDFKILPGDITAERFEEFVKELQALVKEMGILAFITATEMQKK